MSLWQKIDDTTIAILKEQKAFEEETAERLTHLVNSLTGPLVKLFLHRIILDTMRHADMYQTLLELNRRVLLGESDRKVMVRELATHIQVEQKMLDRAVEIHRSIMDTTVQKIIESIIEDERKHHNVLQELSHSLREEEEDWNTYFYEIMKDFP